MNTSAKRPITERPPMTGTPLYQASRWLNLYHPNPGAEMRLFCFSYAGGGASIYSGWGTGWFKIEVCPIQLPGREKRLFEDPFRRMDSLVARLSTELPWDKPFAFFGHSLGATIAFEMTRALRNANCALPTHLFVSGCPAPQASNSQRQRHLMPEPDFIAYLRALGGTTDDVLQNSELMELMMPVIRADFAIADTYSYLQERPLEIPISAFGGALDLEVAENQLVAWRLQTNSDFSLRSFPGGHFFIRDVSEELLPEIRTKMENTKC
jgi:medium-chain acyl-[acyl-carrier-protein] hydrolase